MSLVLLDHPNENYRARNLGSIGASSMVRRPATLSPYQKNIACNYMHQHLSERMVLKDIAGQLHLSTSHFSRAFKNSLGIPVSEWIHHQRISMALVLLNSGKTNICEIAAACGFFDQSHFHRVFKKITGVTPGTWRRSSMPVCP